MSSAAQLQNALTEAAANGEDDIIRVEQGTYVGNFVFDSFEDKCLTLLGGFAPGCDARTLDPANTILDGNKTGRVLYINNPGILGNADIFIEGFMVQNGNTIDLAGGIYAASCWTGAPGSITIKNNIIRDNSAAEGGGLCAYTDDEDFGPLYAGEMDVRIGYKKFPRGLPYRLQTKRNDSGDVVIVNNRIENNNGGGIVVGTNADLTAGSIFIAGNDITGNTGRGVRTNTWEGYTEIYGNTIAGNTSSGKGGGAYASSYTEYGRGDVFFVNNVIAGNSSVEGGGAYASTSGGALTLTNNTITGNIGSGAGGGVLVEWPGGSPLNLYNNIIWGNSAPAGGDIYMKVDPEEMEWIESGGFNNDYSDFDGIWTDWGGNIHSNPRFQDPENKNFRLKSTSPCIDAGFDSAPGLPEDDFEGGPRVFDGNGDATAAVDIGAHEFFGVPLQTLTILSSEGGFTSPPAGEHIYAQGTEDAITAIPDDHFGFNNWSGDVAGLDNPVSITMDSDMLVKANFIRTVYPPADITGQKVENRSLFQTEYVNVLSWKANPDNLNVAKYRVYLVEDGIKNLLVELGAGTFFYRHRNVEKDKRYSYALCAVNDEGREGLTTLVTVQ